MEAHYALSQIEDKFEIMAFESSPMQKGEYRIELLLQQLR